MRHVGLVHHEEGDGDCLLPQQVRVNVPEDQDEPQEQLKGGPVDWERFHLAISSVMGGKRKGS